MQQSQRLRSAETPLQIHCAPRALPSGAAVKNCYRCQERRTAVPQNDAALGIPERSPLPTGYRSPKGDRLFRGRTA